MTARCTVTALFLAWASAATGAEKSAPPLPPEQFLALHQSVKRQPHEARYLEVDWYPSIWEARQRAAREGKPIFIWAGSEGAPAAGC